jgi:S-adenosylmethionine/arginine decarboxylase-like enzyme
MDFRDRVEGLWDENIPIVRQWVIEGIGIHPTLIDNEKHLRRAADNFCKKLDVTVLETLAHSFEPQGRTVIYMLAESHIAIHSWPELKYVHIDMVTCKKVKVDIGEIANIFDECFSPSHCRAFSVKY